MLFKIVKQHDTRDCGAACLSMICRYYKLNLPIAKFREIIKIDNRGANIYGIVDGANKLGLKATALKGNTNEFIDSIQKKEISFPCIVRFIIAESTEHYVVVYKFTNKYIYVADPSSGKKKYRYDDFFKLWTGHVVIFEKTENFIEKNECKSTIIQFVKLVANQKKLVVSVFFVSLLISLIGILGTFIFQIIIDGIGNHQTNVFFRLTFDRICIGIIILYIFQMVIKILRGYFLSIISQNVDLNLMFNYYNHVVDLPIKHLNGRKTGDLMSRFNDLSSIKETVSCVTLSLMIDTSMVILCIFVLYTINYILFFITLFTVLMYAIVVVCFLGPIKNINQKLMEENAEVMSYLKESIDGIETVKAFGAENIIKEKMKSKFIKLVKKSMKSSIIYIVQDSLSGGIASVGIIIFLWTGTILVRNNIVSLGSLITFYSLFGFFLNLLKD